MSDDDRHDAVQWIAKIRLAKFNGDWTAEQIDAGEADQALTELIEREGNLLLIGGASVLWECLKGNGTSGAGALAFFSNANARIGVGDSSTAAAATQTDLQAAAGATHRQFTAMDATYPTHTDGTGSAGTNDTITFRVTVATGNGNFHWQEWCIDNGTRLLNRKAEDLGTKTSAATWQFTVTVALA